MYVMLYLCCICVYICMYVCYVLCLYPIFLSLCISLCVLCSISILCVYLCLSLSLSLLSLSLSVSLSLCVLSVCVSVSSLSLSLSLCLSLCLSVFPFFLLLPSLPFGVPFCLVCVPSLPFPGPAFPLPFLACSAPFPSPALLPILATNSSSDFHIVSFTHQISAVIYILWAIHSERREEKQSISWMARLLWEQEMVSLSPKKCPRSPRFSLNPSLFSLSISVFSPSSLSLAFFSLPHV